VAVTEEMSICGICGAKVPLELSAAHLWEHGFSMDEIANAEVEDLTDEEDEDDAERG
jgi:hypothetical protein